MGTALHSFIDIFDANFETDQGSVKLKKIVIPAIQRDYAQGRKNPEVDRVRRRFLNSLYTAITATPITLDFVYGDIDENGVMTPLDGQQRLTTLFLLHWYAAKKEDIPEEAYRFLHQFSYETRYSARDFCRDLVRFSPSFSGTLSREIVNQAWFPLDWQKDPTIASMLVMLDAIEERFRGVNGIWSRLNEQAITFYFLPIKDMGLTDELYIKMNSRGKPLTLFEHFKAELEREIGNLEEETANRIATKIDLTWMDLLWQYRDGKNGSPEGDLADDKFLRYFQFICDIICYQQGKSPANRSNDEFDLIKLYFSARNPDTPQDIKLLEAFFDCWCDIPGYDTPADFLSSFMSDQYETGKILVDTRRYQIDILGDCLHAYSDKTGRIRQFPLNRIVLLYAITVYLRSLRGNQNQITTDAFARRIRIVNNLIQNSPDEISDRADRNRIPAILKQVDVIILTGEVDDSIENSFNVNQLQEEKEKSAYLKQHPEDAEILFRLEDHPMLKGQIAIVGLDHLAYADRFASLFTCSWDKIDCALMAIGDYGQRERNKWRYQYASSTQQLAWDQLFHKSANTGFENTSRILLELLSSNQTFSDDILQNIADSFLASCESRQEYPWRYYYIKYPAFRPGKFGKLSNGNATVDPYLFSVLQTRLQWSQNTYLPYLKIADEAHLSEDSMGQRLVYGDRHIICENAAYVLRKNEDECEIERVVICQNSDGIDTEDRIIKLKKYIVTLNI